MMRSTELENEVRYQLSDPRNDLSVLAALWNAGPRTRRIALDMADDDLRQFQRQQRSVGKQEKSR